MEKDNLAINFQKKKSFKGFLQVDVKTFLMPKLPIVGADINKLVVNTLSKNQQSGGYKK